MKKYLLLLSFLVTFFLFGQESVTKKYLAGDNITTVKNFSKTYTDDVLTKKYTIKNLGDPKSNQYDVEYTAQEDIGYAVIIVSFAFRKKDFTIQLKSINFHNKKTGAVVAITNRDSVESIADYYQLTKKLLVTLHADYLAPNLLNN